MRAYFRFSSKHGVAQMTRFLLLASGVLLLSACEQKEVAAPPIPTVEVIKIAPQNAPIVREWVGVLDGNVNATIRPQVTGYLVKQNYKEGEFVEKGQVLFEIDARTYKTSTQQAAAILSQQRALHTNAQASLERVRPLAEKNALSKKDLDDAISREASSRGALDQARAAFEASQLNLGFTRITSPIDGIAGIAKAQVGDLLSPAAQSELTTVSNVSPIKVTINISEREYLRIVENGTEKFEKVPLELVLVDGSVFPEKGLFTVIDRQVDVNTGTFSVAASFPNPEAALRPGQFARVRATLAVREGAILVPQRAVTEIQGRYFVAVIGAENKAEVRPIKATERIGANWLITEGLKIGETIVVEGTQKARAGAVVNPVPFVPKNAGNAAEKEAPKKVEEKTEEKANSVVISASGVEQKRAEKPVEMKQEEAKEAPPEAAKAEKEKAKEAPNKKAAAPKKTVKEEVKEEAKEAPLEKVEEAVKTIPEATPKTISNETNEEGWTIIKLGVSI